jgi:hypothetical protein
MPLGGPAGRGEFDFVTDSEFCGCGSQERLWSFTPPRIWGSLGRCRVEALSSESGVLFGEVARPVLFDSLLMLIVAFGNLYQNHINRPRRQR